MDDLITIIIPVYKVEAYLNQCVKSVVKQTYTNLEIILVDDGSPDNCPEMCDFWKTEDSRIRVIHKENGGLSDARNAGLRAANGEYISFVDSDDYISCDMLENLYTCIQSANSQISVCKYISFNDASILDGYSHDAALQNNYSMEIVSTEKALAMLIENKKLQQVVWNKLYRKDVVCDIFFEVGKQHEDSFWSYQVVGNADRIAIADYTGYYYRQREDSIMGSGFGMKNLDSIEARINRIEYLSTQYPELVSLAANELQGMCIYMCQKAIKENTITGTERETMIRYLHKIGSSGVIVGEKHPQPQCLC